MELLEECPYCGELRKCSKEFSSKMTFWSECENPSCEKPEEHTTTED